MMRDREYLRGRVRITFSGEVFGLGIIYGERRMAFVLGPFLVRVGRRAW